MSEATLEAAGKLGDYRAVLGWGPGRKNNSVQDTAYLLRDLPPFRR